MTIISEDYIVCGRIFNPEGETGSIHTIYWNVEKKIVSIGYYKYQEADGHESDPETFTYYTWERIPTFQEVIQNNMTPVEYYKANNILKDTNEESSITDLNISITCGKVPYFEWI